MKFPDFRYARPADLPEALTLLGDDDATAMAGGQSLLTVMGFRLAMPTQIVDISALPELRAIDQGRDRIEIGAAVRHARLEDGAVEGPLGAFLSVAARNIGYRAIRNRGTIGGSLAHADPAADWPVVLAALDADVEIAGPSGGRTMPVEQFILGEMTTALGPGELLAKIRIGRSGDTGYGVHKITRKKGEFANAIAAVVLSGETVRFAVGVVAGRPLVFSLTLSPAAIDPASRLTGTAAYRAILDAIATAAPEGEDYGAHLAAVAACQAARAAWDDREARG